MLLSPERWLQIVSMSCQILPTFVARKTSAQCPYVLLKNTVLLPEKWWKQVQTSCEKWLLMLSDRRLQKVQTSYQNSHCCRQKNGGKMFEVLQKLPSFVTRQKAAKSPNVILKISGSDGTGIHRNFDALSLVEKKAKSVNYW